MVPSFRVLGRLEVSRADGTLVAVGRRKQRALLAVLLLRAGTVVRTAEVTEALWGECPPPSARANLHSYVSELRRVLDSVREAGGTRLAKVAGGYRLDITEGECDALLFASLAARGQQALMEDRPVLAANQLGRALALWRGSPLEDLVDLDWFAPDVARLAEARLTSMEDHAQARLALGEHAVLAAELAGVVAAHPLRERLWAHYLRALYGSGNRTRALNEYATLRSVLRTELGIGPGHELQRLHRQIADDAQPEQSPEQLTVAAVIPAQLPPGVADFTGREEQVRLLHKVLEPGGDPMGLKVAGITGMAGVGKTTLALHVAHSIADAYPGGQLYADLAGTDASPPKPADVLSRFLRAMGVPGPAIPPGTGERGELYRSLLAGRRILVVLDDAASERQVRPLLPGGVGCAVLVTSRRWLPGIACAQWTQLDVLHGDEGVRLLARVLPDSRVDDDPCAAADVVRLCGGLPLAVRIAGARLTSRPRWTVSHLVELLRDEQRRLDRLDISDLGVRASLMLSYYGLTPSARRLFRLISVFNVPDFPGWLATVVSPDAPQSGARDLDLLVDVHLVTMVGIDVAGQVRYRFHDLVRLFARDRVEAEETPEVLREVVGRGLGAWLAVAERLERGLPGTCYAPITGVTVRPDVEHVLADLAAIDPFRWFDAEQATVRALVRQACERGDAQAAFDLAQRMEKYFDVRGMYAEWEATSHLALAACRRSGDVRGETVMLRGLVDVTTWITEDRTTGAMSRLHAEAQHVQELFHQVGEYGGMADAAVMRSWSLTATGRHHDAIEVATTALGWAVRSAHLGGQARAHVALAVALGESGQLTDAVGHLYQALPRARELRNPRWEATVLQFLGIACNRAGQFDAASRYLAESLAISQRHRDTYAEVVSLTAMARLGLCRGDDTARSVAAAALAAARKNRMAHHIADSLSILGELELTVGRTAEAAVYLRESVDLWRTRGWLRFQAQTLVLLGRALGDANREAGLAALSEADELFRRVGDTAQAEVTSRLMTAMQPAA